MLMKKAISILLFISLFFSLSIPAFASEQDLFPEDVVQPEVRHDVLNDEGILETQEIISLGEGDTLPSYITDIEYLSEDINELGEDIGAEIQPSLIPEEINSKAIAPTAASVTKYERESNNTSSSANVYNDNENMYGSINPAGDVDWYRVYWDVDGTVDFSLQNIPSNCNYDLKIFSQPKGGGSVSLYRTAATSGPSERLNAVPVTNDKIYYMNVYSSRGSSPSQYLLNAKITRLGDTFEPNDDFKTAKVLTSSSTASATIHKPTDVDFYSVNVSSGVLSLRLTGIPYGTDYRFDVYNSLKTLVYQVTESGNKEKKTDLPVSSGTYYIKIYSKSGANPTSKYSLYLTHRSPQTKVSGTISIPIQSNGGSSERTTAIPNLPIKIVYTRGISQIENTITSTTTNSSGGFTASFSLPTDVKHLYVKVYPDDSTLSVMKVDKTLSTFLWEIPYNIASVSVNVHNNITSQLKAVGAIWKNGKDGLSYYKTVTGRTPSKLVFHCTAGSGTDTNYNYSEDRIILAGNSSMKDYYDRDVIFHEMGHWEMYHNGGLPNGAGGSHDWQNPSSPSTAYSEGWAHFFSCSLRNDSYLRDYTSSGSWFGGNLSSGEVKPSSSSNLMSKPPQRQPYADNAKLEANVGSTLWNLSNNGGPSNFRTLDGLVRNKSNGFREYYEKYMSSISSSLKESAWTIFNKFHVAYDMNPPTVRISTSGQTVSMTATDDIAVKKYEWYVDGALKTSGFGASSSLDLSRFSLSPGMHTVECRAYDPEGLISNSMARPRTDRYGAAITTVAIASTSRSPSLDLPGYASPDFINQPSGCTDEDISVKNTTFHEDTLTNEPESIENGEFGSSFVGDNAEDLVKAAGPFELERIFSAEYMGEPLGLAALEQSESTVMPGDSGYVDIVAPGDSDLLLFCLSSNAIKEYRIIAPDGTVYDAFEHISSGQPYVIPNAEAGIWTIEFENYDINDAARIFEEQGQADISQNEIAVSPATVGVVFGLYTDFALDLPDITNNPRILNQLYGQNDNLAIYESGDYIDPLVELSDGWHEFLFVKQAENGVAQESHCTVLIDTEAPIATIEEVPSSTTRDRVELHMAFSEDIAEMYINGQEYVLGSCSHNSFSTCIPLLPGKNHISLSFRDYAGNANEVYIDIERVSQ